MTEDIDYQTLYEQLTEENIKLRMHITKLTLNPFSINTLINTAQDIIRNGYFWCGYFVAIIVMLFIGVFRNFKEG